MVEAGKLEAQSGNLKRGSGGQPGVPSIASTQSTTSVELKGPKMQVHGFWEVIWLFLVAKDSSHSAAKRPKSYMAIPCPGAAPGAYAAKTRGRSSTASSKTGRIDQSERPAWRCLPDLRSWRTPVMAQGPQQAPTQVAYLSRPRVTTFHPVSPVPS
jgi:hypothetical protein